MNEFTYVVLVQIEGQGLWLIRQEEQGWVKHRQIKEIIDIEPETGKVSEGQVIS
jgi:hypothetical protein